MNAPSLTFKNFFTHPYMLHPNALKNPTDKAICWLGTILLGVSTAGVVHATTALIKCAHPSQSSNAKFRKTDELSRNVLQGQNKKTPCAKSLYIELEGETEIPEYLRLNEVVHNFYSIQCPKETAVIVGEHFLHGNFVKVLERNYIATQAPLHNPDLFWQACFEHSYVVVDLTGKNEIPPYYPKSLGEVKNYDD